MGTIVATSTQRRNKQFKRNKEYSYPEYTLHSRIHFTDFRGVRWAEKVCIMCYSLQSVWRNIQIYRYK